MGSRIEYLGLDLAAHGATAIAGVRIHVDGILWKQGYWQFSDTYRSVEKDWQLDCPASQVEIEFASIDGSNVSLAAVYATSSILLSSPIDDSDKDSTRTGQNS